MGNDGEDMELEMLRQAALKSLQRNREKKASAKPCNPHRSAMGNRNLIEIQTTEEEFDPDMVEEIVVAEGDDVDDSDCDEVIEEVIMSEDEGSGEMDSPAPSLSDQPPTEERIPKDGDDDGGSSSDEDALSVASRYSLYEDDLLGENEPLQTQPVRVRIPGQPLTSVDDRRDGGSQGTGNNQRRRSRSRSRDRIGRDRSRSPVNRKRRSRDNSPVRRRETRRRSRDRDFRRRSISREREFSRVENRDKSKRKDDRKADRTSPTLLPRKEQPSRRRTRSRSSSRERRNNTDGQSRAKKVEKSPRKSLTPELKPVPGVDQSVLEKRRQKFQGKQPFKIGEEKKIKLHNSRNAREEPGTRKVKSLVSDSSKSEGKVQTEPNSLLLDSEDSLDGRSDSPTNIKVKVVQDDQEQEDLRAKLIKKKRAQQQGHHVGSGRIFSEALKGTRLGPSASSKTSKSHSSVGKSRNNEKVSADHGKGKQVQKRKVSLTYS